MGEIVGVSLGLHLLNLISGFCYDFLSLMRFHIDTRCGFWMVLFLSIFLILGSFLLEAEMLVL